MNASLFTDIPETERLQRKEEWERLLEIAFHKLEAASDEFTKEFNRYLKTGITARLISASSRHQAACQEYWQVELFYKQFH